MSELIICEKPKAAQKVAEALSDGKLIKKSEKGVPYYEIKRDKKNITVASAVGHIYGLTEKKGKKWAYPVFDVEWKPISEINKKGDFSKKYLDVIKKLSKNADEFTIACDYDVEGEVIGLNILRFGCKQKDANRMKFSTLTKPDLIEAYKHKSKHLDWGQAEAGLARHELDWYWGINTSRALTSAIKKAGMWHIMSTGRVQGPALKIVVDKEREIKKFKPEPYWQIELLGHVKKGLVDAWHIKNKFFEKKEADEVMIKTKGHKAIASKLERNEFEQKPPYPFDLTTLQTEAYRCFRIKPKDALAIAQELYTDGLISYPRTSSQQLPPNIGYKKILNELMHQAKYEKHCKELVSKDRLQPNNGKKTDPAHPAIYPTGQKAKLDGRGEKVFDLIVKRFMATFAEPATRETIAVTIDVNKEKFIEKGSRTTKKGWHEFYGGYVPVKEEEVPEVHEGEEVKVKEIKMHAKETTPPPRYTQASIIKELEKRNLGTKCLTSNNFVKVNSNNQIHTENIAELFEQLHGDFPIITNDVKIAINDKKTCCFSFDAFEEKRSYFKLVSKRKLNKGESVYRIEYADGTAIEATQEHPFLMRIGDKIEYIEARNLKKGMKSIASDKFSDKAEGIVCAWEQFLKKCTVKSKLYGIVDELKKRRKKLGLSQHHFGKKYSVKQSQICVYEKKGSVPLVTIRNIGLSKPDEITSVNKLIKIKNPFPLKMSSSLARILANLVGDGSINRELIKRDNTYDFRYHNTNMQLINRFIADIHYIFGLQLKVLRAKPKQGRLPTYYVKIPAVIGRIIAMLFEEVIAKNACRKLSQGFYPEYIGALFDDEGHAADTEPKLFISNTHENLLNDAKRMLHCVGIESIISKKQHKLYIRGKRNIHLFLQKIPVASVKKKQRLVNTLSKFYRYRGNASSPLTQYKVLFVLNHAKDKELTMKEIAEEMGMKCFLVKEHLKYLREYDYAKQIIRGVSAYPRKKITYKLLVPPENTFYKYVGEEVISSNFITKTIASVKKIKYQDYVYDITNTEKIPNFIMANGVVVHNSTRAAIVDTLYQRNYVTGESIGATDLGVSTIETLEKYSPEIIDEELTKHFEDEMEGIREKKKKREEVLEEAKKELTKTLNKFKKKEKIIGENLQEATKETRNEMNTIGKCPNCKDGVLMVRFGKFGRFVACNKYPDCKTTFKLPAGGLVKKTDKLCEQCSNPIIMVIRKGKRPQETCINPECPSKKMSKEEQKEADKIEGKKCKKCGKGKMVLRKGMYGSFMACDQYPKCRNIERLENNNHK